MGSGMNDQQLLRYSQHILLEGLDYSGQQQLLASKVLVVGLGGLGCPAALYLAASGVGELWLADFDTVEVSNLQRQIAYTVDDVGHSKVTSISARIHSLNPDVKLVPISDKLTEKTLHHFVKEVDAVVDASDNFVTRFAVNRACMALSKPLVSGAAIRSAGQVAVFDYCRHVHGPCYACLVDSRLQHNRDHCVNAGVLAPLVGLIGSFQALETVKLLSNFGVSSHGALWNFDSQTGQWHKRHIQSDPLCEVCAEHYKPRIENI